MPIDNLISNYLNDSYMSAGANISQVDRALKNKTCCFITAYLDSKTEKENLEAFKKLSKDLQDLGFGHINLKGVYKGTAEKSMMISMPELNRKNANEEEFVKIMEKLRDKYHQDSILIKLKDEKEAYLSYANGTKRYRGVFQLKDLEKVIPEFYSKIKGHVFVFENYVEDNLKYEMVNTRMAMAFDDERRQRFLKTDVIF